MIPFSLILHLVFNNVHFNFIILNSNLQNYWFKYSRFKKSMLKQTCRPLIFQWHLCVLYICAKREILSHRRYIYFSMNFKNLFVLKREFLEVSVIYYAVIVTWPPCIFDIIPKWFLRRNDVRVFDGMLWWEAEKICDCNEMRKRTWRSNVAAIEPKVDDRNGENWSRSNESSKLVERLAIACARFRHERSEGKP